MLLIRTIVGASAIHGNGVFADEEVPVDTIVWRFEPMFDRVISASELKEMPAPFREYIEMYAYPSSDLKGRLLLPCDHAKFLNHSENPNTAQKLFKSIASKPISKGEEITCNYGAFCVDWAGFG